jgi:small-conductance mechanosensitive channel
MTTLHASAEEPEHQSNRPGPSRDGPVHPLRDPDDVADLIRGVNESNETVEDLCLRARQAADLAARSDEMAETAAEAATGAKVAYRAVQAEYPRRQAALPRQVVLALVTVGLDGLACYFAAQALDGSQNATLVWAGLFLAVLAAGEVALDFYRDRHQRAWRGLVGLLAVFITVLGILRFWYLATVGYGGLVPAVAGACLFTAATAGFVFLGYRALQAAESPRAWRARRWARAAARKAEAARAMADRDAAERDRLVDAYIDQVRRFVLRTCPASQQLAMESAVRDHLLGKVQAAA